MDRTVRYDGTDRFPLTYQRTASLAELGIDARVFVPPYNRASDMLPAARTLMEQRVGTWIPIVLHTGWESEDDFESLAELARLIAPYAPGWGEFLEIAASTAQTTEAKPPFGLDVDGGRLAIVRTMRETVTACLIVLNEAERLPAALESVAFCDEVVVVDSGSTDGTVEIAREAGAHVVVNPWPGYGAQRNVAIERASGEWILEIDADERVTPELRRSIEALLADPPKGFDMAVIPLRHRFFGRQLGPAGRYPLYRSRLFRRSAYRHDESRTVHEGLWSNGPVAVLEGDLEHILAGSWSEALHDIRRYAQLDAQQVGMPRTPLAAAKALVVRPAGKFGVRTVVYGGWRDGWQGLTKIALDVATDVLVGYHAVRRGQQAGAPEVPPIPRKGAVRLVGIASANAGPDAARWLSEAASLGADVALITSAVVPPETIRVLRVPRFGPLLVIRALDAENQLRSVDAVVTAGVAAERLARLLPAQLKGIVDPISIAVDAGHAVARVERSRRTR